MTITTPTVYRPQDRPCEQVTLASLERIAGQDARRLWGIARAAAGVNRPGEPTLDELIAILGRMAAEAASALTVAAHAQAVRIRTYQLLSNPSLVRSAA